MIEFRKLTKDDTSSLNELIDVIQDKNEHPEWCSYISQIQKNKFIDDSSNMFIGAFDTSKLVAAIGLIYDEKLSETNLSSLGINGKFAEIGRCMVLPEYRGEDLMIKLGEIIIDEARKLGKTYIVAAVHPDNIGAIKSIEKLGFEKKCKTSKWNGTSRYYYTKKL
jgi:RimJ/RimL family protein N-acetyltransferase